MQFGTQVEGEKGHVSAHLTWPGVPEASAIGRLSGRLEISAAKGQLTSVEPGAGRVFGLMSLAHLPRRLALDFNDLTGEGLSFDTLRGTFQLTDGDAYTDNLTLRGSAAEIGIAGHTSLRNRTYDQTAVVTGQLWRLPRRRRARSPAGLWSALQCCFSRRYSRNPCRRDAWLLSHHRKLG